MKRSLAEALTDLKIKVSNRKMNKYLKENGVDFQQIKHVKSIRLERKNNNPNTKFLK
jgi:NACalpha-BTF3-like transcription factor